MSDERLRELGIRRRTFLKRAAAAGFIAPVVVSFTLDGVAEAGTQSASNQCRPQQLYRNLTYNSYGQGDNCQGQEGPN
jgi:hypothetical protein